MSIADKLYILFLLLIIGTVICALLDWGSDFQIWFTLGLSADCLIAYYIFSDQEKDKLFTRKKQ